MCSAEYFVLEENMQKPLSIQRFVVPIVLIAFVAALGYGLTKPAAVNTSSLEGKPAPDFTLKTLEGTDLTLSSFKGRPVVVNFFASWCGPCRLEHPLLMELSKRTDIRLYGINNADKAENARRFLGTLASRWTQGSGRMKIGIPSADLSAELRVEVNAERANSR